MAGLRGIFEPMHHIANDILAGFGGESRLQAALNSLAELAENIQVILFTHHSRVVEQAEVVSGSVHVHEL